MAGPSALALAGLDDHTLQIFVTNEGEDIVTVINLAMEDSAQVDNSAFLTSPPGLLAAFSSVTGAPLESSSIIEFAQSEFALLFEQFVEEYFAYGAPKPEPLVALFYQHILRPTIDSLSQGLGFKLPARQTHEQLEDIFRTYVMEAPSLKALKMISGTIEAIANGRPGEPAEAVEQPAPAADEATGDVPAQRETRDAPPADESSKKMGAPSNAPAPEDAAADSPATSSLWFLLAAGVQFHREPLERKTAANSRPQGWFHRPSSRKGSHAPEADWVA
jgi:hypothetical protein